MNKKKEIVLLGENPIDNFLAEKSFNSIRGIELSIFHNPILFYSFLLNSKTIPSYIFIDVQLNFIYGMEVLRKVKLLNVPFQNTQFYFVYNLNDELDNYVNKVAYEFLYEKFKVDFIEKPLTKEIIKQYIYN